MHYVIMGCGRVGSSLARGLENRGHTVAVIDVVVDAFRRLGPSFHGTTVKGVGFDRDVLITAGIQHADGFAAVSNGDNSNILGARVARENFGVANVVARIYDPSRAQVYERLGIPTVATVRWAAEQIMGRLIDLGPEFLWRDPSGAVRLIRVSYHPDWVGTPISVIQKRLRTPVPALARFGTAITTDDTTVLQEHDLLYTMVDQSRLEQCRALLANPPDKN
ncbi:MAG: TrkA family potassium uptake protein [Propionibacteriaceae bacterium]|nr:TrkA family potassium uptake protein [Propionibacteriaceae bacterium]